MILSEVIFNEDMYKSMKTKWDNDGLMNQLKHGCNKVLKRN